MKQIQKKQSLPKLINSNYSETTSKSIKIAKEEALGCSISMNHYKSGRILFAIKSNRVDEPWFIA